MQISLIINQAARTVSKAPPSKYVKCARSPWHSLAQINLSSPIILRHGAEVGTDKGASQLSMQKSLDAILKAERCSWIRARKCSLAHLNY